MWIGTITDFIRGKSPWIPIVIPARRTNPITALYNAKRSEGGTMMVIVSSHPSKNFRRCQLALNFFSIYLSNQFIYHLYTKLNSKTQLTNTFSRFRYTHKLIGINKVKKTNYSFYGINGLKWQQNRRGFLQIL